MTAAEVGWALLALVPVMMLVVVWPMLDDGAAGADVHRIEVGIGTIEPERERCPDPCHGRHCAAHASVHGTIAQRRHSRAAEQRDAHRWNLPTQAMPLVGEIVSDPYERFEACRNPYAVHTDAGWTQRPGIAAIAAMWANADVDGGAPIGRPPVELMHVGKRERRAVAA